jgi:hypothetical protein
VHEKEANQGAKPMHFTTLKKLAISAILGITFTPSASANLIVNGDFEAEPTSTSLQAWRSDSVKLYDGEDVAGWNNGTTEGGGDNVELWTVSSNTFAELNSHDNTTGQTDTGDYWNLSQHFTAVIGQQYLFTFDYKARKNSNEQFKVRIGTHPSPDFFETFDDHITTEWTGSGDKFFVASASNLRLNFFSPHSDGSVGNFIDNVSITAVPETGSLALLGLGLVGLGLARRKKA